MHAGATTSHVAPARVGILAPHRARTVVTPCRFYLWALAIVVAAPAWAADEPVDLVARTRVLVVGIDGASPRVAFPLVGTGELPNLQSLARAGAFGPLRSLRPIHSPRIWNSIATGKIPDKHGIKTFFKKRDGERQLYTSADRVTHALWNIASDRGLRVGVVNWWTTYPPERIDGVMVSDHYLPRNAERIRKLAGVKTTGRTGPIAHPQSWIERVARLASVKEPLTNVPDPFSGPDLPPWVNEEGLSGIYRDDAKTVRIALAIEAAINPDLLMVFLPGIDRVSHALWGTLEPEELYPEGLRPSPAERRAGRRALHSYYRYSDALIGLLLERYSPEDAVIVVSDHGFEAGVLLGSLTGVHNSKKALDGVVYARGPGVEPGSRAVGVSVLDVAPSVLAWLGLPRALDMDGSTPNFLHDAPRLAIATYDTTPIERAGDAPSGVEDEIIEQLRALGYGD